MDKLIIELFEDGSLCDLETKGESVMDLMDAIYAVEFNGKEYKIDDDYYFKHMKNSKELNIKLLVYDNEVIIDKK